MYLESAKSQATSLSSISAQCVQQNIELIKVLENFVAEEELKGHAYDSAKAHITSTVIPLIQGIVLYQESLAEECQKFVSQYTSDVDSKSWRQVDLEEKIREADQKISSLRQLMETKSDNKISAFLNLSVSIAVLEGAKQKLQKILISLLTFNAVSPTIFLNSERYLLAVQNGFAQAAQSWDAASGTYLPPSSGTDLLWKQTISLGWQKRQDILNKVKNPKVETLEEKLSKMSRAELEEEYGTVIQSYKRFLTMGQGDNVTATMDFEDVKLIWKRYNEVKDDHLGLLPSELAKVDPKFKKRIDAMDQEALEEAYPELKTLISMAYVNPYAQLFKSETDRANDHYLLDRYFLLDSQKMLSWRDPAFQTKYDYYIIEEGIDPFTGKPATQEEINRAKNIKKVRAFTDTLQLASTLYTSYVGYNQYYNKPYTTFSDVYSKVKGKIPVFNRNPVIPVFSNRYSKIDFTQTDFDVELIRGRLKTDPDTAFFWSGRTDGIGGMDVAKKIAKNKGGVTLESTIDDTNIVMPEWDFNTPSSVTAWEEASNVYAEQVSGEIRAVVGSELRPGNIWENIELPRLKANPNVTKVTTIDPKTGVEKIIFER